MIESDDTEETKKAIEPPGDDGRYDPATAGTRRRSPIRSVVTRLGRSPMTSTATTPDSPDNAEGAKRQKKHVQTPTGGTADWAAPERQNARKILQRPAKGREKKTAREEDRRQKGRTKGSHEHTE